MTRYIFPCLVSILITTIIIPKIIYYLIGLTIISVFFLKNSKLHYLCFLSICITCLFLSYIHFETVSRLNIINTYPSTKNTSFTGQVTYKTNQKIKINTSHGFLLTGFLNTPYSKIHVGDYVNISGYYNKPSKPSNPGQYNYFQRALYHKNLGIMAVKNIKKINESPLFNLDKLSYIAKQAIIKQHQTSLPNPHATIYSALIFGENYSELTPAIKQLFKKAGLIHAIVVSGSQVSLVLGMCHLIFNWLGIYRYYQLIFLIPISIFFFVLTGGGASVLRAIIMAHLMFIIKFGCGYKTTPLHTISFTAFIMIIMDPFVVYKMGAILSFLATFSLVFGTDLLQKQFPKQMPSAIKEGFALAIAPWAFTTPVLIFKFHSLPFGAILSNLFLIQIIELTVIIGFAGTLLGILFLPLASLFHQSAGGLIEIIILISTWVNKLPFAEIPLKDYRLNTLLFLIAIGSLFYKNFKIIPKLKIATCCLLIGMISFYWQYDNRTIITQLDVGQGDAAIIKTNQLSCLIDTGPPYDQRLGSIASSVLFPALRYYGIAELDYLILTHFDKDHVGNLKKILETIPVKKIIHNGNLDTYLKRKKISLPKNTSSHILCDNNTISIDSLHIEFLNACTKTQHLSKNNQSLVFKISQHPYSMLFTGDIEKETEYYLLQHQSKKLSSTLLKVAHHGSKTSSTDPFLKTVNPSHLIISAGKNNRYNHPNPTILSQLNSFGSLWRTDLTGAIVIRFAKQLQIKAFL
jgi:competence protein ComEC